MKVILASTLLLCLSLCGTSQDTALTFSRVIVVDSLTQGVIYDKITVWCSKQFVNSKNATMVTNRESGILSGKANTFSPYKTPKKKDSTDGVFFNDYYFDWLIEIKDNKFRFSVSNVEVDAEHYHVTSKTKAPLVVMFWPQAKTDLAWKLSKEYFISHLSGMIDDMKTYVTTKDNW